MNTYVIGDVHGHYDTLMQLVAKLPCDAKLVFVGDIIDRGKKSAEVVRFVREGGHLCVMGNHEELMIKDAPYVLNAYDKDRTLDLYSTWFSNGGTWTLTSYNIIKLLDGRPHKVEKHKEALAQIRSDLKWMEELPLYIELDIKHTSNKPVVVTHACVGNVWHFHDDPENLQTFKEHALWNRKHPPKEMPIFNIYGHTPVEFGVEIEDDYVNVDTGCYLNTYGYSVLSAYCVETGEVVNVNRRVEELKKVDNNAGT